MATKKSAETGKKRRANRTKAEIAQERLAQEQGRLDRAVQKQDRLRAELEQTEAQIQEHARRVQYLASDPDLPADQVDVVGAAGEVSPVEITQSA